MAMSTMRTKGGAWTVRAVVSVAAQGRERYGRSRFGMALVIAAVLALLPRVARAEPPAMKEREGHPRLQVRSHDDRFSLALGGYLQARYTASARGDEVEQSEFTAPRTRLYFFGHVHSRDVRYRLTFGTLAGAQQVRVVEAYVEYRIADALRLRAGRYKIPVMREWVESANYLASVERSTIVQMLLPGRDYGLMANGEIGDLEYTAGVFNGAGGLAVRDSNLAPALAGRVLWNFHHLPIDGEVDFEDSAPRFSLGVSAMTTSRPFSNDANAAEPVVTPHLRESLGGVDFALRARGFDLTAEAMARQRSFDGGGRDRIIGGYIRGDKYLPALKSVIGVRTVRIHGLDDANVSRTELELDAGFFPAEHDLKLIVNVGRALLHSSRRWHTILMVQVQAGF